LQVQIDFFGEDVLCTFFDSNISLSDGIPYSEYIGIKLKIKDVITQGKVTNPNNRIKILDEMIN
jgi:hypothetical protein